jgi:uncharacterized membrane protein (UPF0127 family)
MALVAAGGCGRPAADRASVVVGDVTFGVEIAQTPAERRQGLSGRDSLQPMTGMLFVFESGRATPFWMKGMRLPLDFIWIGEECTVVDTAPNVPPPAEGAAGAELPSYRSGVPAAYVFEVNAGDVERYGIVVGDTVRFSDLSPDVTGAEC